MTKWRIQIITNMAIITISLVDRNRMLTKSNKITAGTLLACIDKEMF